jgi:hypothetical protein
MTQRRAVARRHRVRVRTLLDRVIEEGINSGTFEPRDKDRAAVFVLDACFRFIHPVAVESEGGCAALSQFDQRLGNRASKWCCAPWRAVQSDRSIDLTIYN